MSETKPCRFFLGANSPQGFYSLFDELEDEKQPWHSFLIKGGPGCGKSSFLKRIAAAFGASCPQMELFPCSSDPDSLDAVILPERHLSLMDATAPHAKEAALPALRHTLLSFGDHLDGMILQKKRREIEGIHGSSAEYTRLSTAYLAAAQTFLRNSFHLASCAVDEVKVEGYARRFAAKNFRPTGKEAVEKHRFLSTVCADGIVVLEETPSILCRKLYLIDDDCGAVAHLLLTALKKLALEAGHTVISCNCPMDPDNKLEHLLVPTAGIGFLTSNHFHPMENCAAQRKIHARRFQNQELMNSRKTRFLYNRKAAQVLLEQAIVLLKERSQLHDELERFYISAMDFGALNQRYPRLMKLILDYSHKNEQ